MNPKMQFFNIRKPLCRANHYCMCVLVFSRHWHLLISSHCSSVSIRCPSIPLSAITSSRFYAHEHHYSKSLLQSTVTWGMCCFFWQSVVTYWLLIFCMFFFISTYCITIQLCCLHITNNLSNFVWYWIISFSCWTGFIFLFYHRLP